MDKQRTGPCGPFKPKLPFLSKFCVFLFLSLAGCYVITTNHKQSMKFTFYCVKAILKSFERNESMGKYLNCVIVPSGLVPDNSIGQPLAGRPLAGWTGGGGPRALLRADSGWVPGKDALCPLRVRPSLSGECCQKWTLSKFSKMHILHIKPHFVQVNQTFLLVQFYRIVPICRWHHWWRRLTNRGSADNVQTAQPTESQRKES
jgi:hypothetical protein